MTHIFHRNPNQTLLTAVAGDGCFLVDAQGRRYFDGSGGAAVSCLGHGHPAVLAAMQEQMQSLEYAHTSFFTTPVAEELATLLAENSPPSLGNVYFLSGGSEAMETALKMARQYQVEIGQTSRYRFIARRQSYHGNTLGALAIGGNLPRRKLYEPILMESHHVSPCYAFRYRHPQESDTQYVSRLGDELEKTILSLGAETVAGFVAETIVGATSGAVPPVAGYFARVREICDRYGVLLILDEVMCGMGRTGYYHAFETENVVPDILTLAKGLGGGYQPIGAVLTSDKVVRGITENSGSFQHGHTYIGHPIACAAALAVQKEILQTNLLTTVCERGEQLRLMLEARFADHANIADIRGRGLFQAIELVHDRASNQPFPAAAKINAKIKQAAFNRGLLCYPAGGTIDGVLGDHVLLAPPYISTEAELSTAVEILGNAVDEVLKSQ